MKKRIASAIAALSILLGMSNLNVVADESKYTEIYVATTGSDENSGSIDSPLQTAAAARDMIRKLKEEGKIKEKGAVVYFREGIYSFTETLELDSRDSGTQGAPVTYRAYPDEEVKFVGGVDINPTSFEQVTDKRVLNRMTRKDMEGLLYRVNLREIGVKEIPMPYLLGNYSYWQVDGVVQEKSVIMADLVEALGYSRNSAKSPELFINGELMTISKYPNEGYLKVDVVTQPGPFMRNWNDDIIGSSDWVPPESRIPTPFKFVCKDVNDRLKYWQSADQALLWGRWYWEWATQSVPLDCVEPSTGEIISAVPSAFSIRANQPWYIYNLLEEIDEPGEYFLDRNTGYLYLYPPCEIENANEAVLTLLDGPTVRVVDAAFINFKGIDSGRSRRNAFYVTNSDNIHISDAEISFTASTSVIINKSTNSTVKNCYIHDVDGGVNFSDCGDMVNLIPGNCGVENCEIEWFARLTGTYTTAASISGCGNYIRNNEIHRAQHMAISFNGPYQEVSFNNIYDVCREADDSGVIYVGRSIATHWGSVIKNNYIHDCTPVANFQVGTIAVYLDDFLSGVTVAGNVIENMQIGGMFSGYNNIWTNNIFINNKNNALITAFGANISTVDLQPTLIAGWKNATYKTNDAWKEAFPALYALTEDNLKNDSVSTGCIVANNYMWNSAGMTLEQKLINSPANIIKDNISSNKDPGFVDAGNKIYLLKEDAQIYKDLPDFQPIPFTRIGLYNERAIARIKEAVTLVIDSPYVLVEGSRRMINEQEPEQMPVIINNYTYVPFRFLGEALGMNVSYDEENRIATFENDAYTLTFSLNELDKVIKNSEEIKMEVPIKVINGRTYMPLRSVSEMIDKEVFWDDCGFIAVSETEDLFSSKYDEGLIDYLYGKLGVR